ncbi:MAG: 2-C-methyl-D-erythritol 4-phosphate cytidylyltransferase [Rhodothermales bacterium]
MAGERIAAIMPAAGSGARLGGERKQFRLLGDEPLLLRTARVFAAHPQIDLLVLTLPEADHAEIAALLEAAALDVPVLLAPGGATRQASVRSALRRLPPDVDMVLVHDAVRPFIRAEQISRVIEGVRTTGAAALAVELTDTLRRGDRARFGETIPRDGLYRMQTPQGARRAWYEEAHAAAERDGVDATDDVALVQRLGYPVAIVAGGPLNMKVTTPADWELAVALWPFWTSMET